MSVKAEQRERENRISVFAKYSKDHSHVVPVSNKSGTQQIEVAMDSEVTSDGRLMDITDAEWQGDPLPEEDIAVPQMELPEIEPENGPTTETLKEQEQKWTDLALTALHDQPPPATGS